MRALKIIVEALFWMLTAGVALFGVGTVVGLTMAPPLGYVAAAAMLGLLPLMLRFSRIVRRRRAAAAISYLEQAVRLNLPLTRMLYAAQRSEEGKLAYRLAVLRHFLEEGYPIGSAVESAVPEVTARQAALIEISERLGRLPQTLQKLVREQAGEAIQQQHSDVTFGRTYPLLMSVSICGVLGVVGIFVLPKYQTIFKDFGIPLPQITQTIFSLAATLGPYVLALVMAAVLWGTGLSLWQTFRPQRFAFTIGRGLWDRIVWTLPVAGTIARDRGLADALGLIADAVRIGMPADRALAETAQLDVNAVLRGKLARWSDALAGGLALADGARAAGMPRLISGMIATAHGADATADVLAFLGRYYQTRFSRTAALIEAALVPAMVFFFGFIVAAVALSMFTPLVAMIDSISGAAPDGWVK